MFKRGKAKVPAPVSTAPWLMLEQEGHMRRLLLTLRRQPDTGAYGLGLNDFNAVIDVPPSSSLERNDVIVEVAGKTLNRGEKLQDYVPAGDSMRLVVLRPLISIPELQKALGAKPAGRAFPDSKAYAQSLAAAARPVKPAAPPPALAVARARPQTPRLLTPTAPPAVLATTGGLPSMDDERQSSGPKRRSSARLSRRDSAAPYSVVKPIPQRGGEASSSTGLTPHMAQSMIDQAHAPRHWAEI